MRILLDPREISNKMFLSVESKIPAVTPRFLEAEHISQAPQKPYRYTKLAFVWLLACVVLGSGLGCRRTANRRLDFNQDVQPILASRCFGCHGPDPEMRKACLRLDLEEWA